MIILFPCYSCTCRYFSDKNKFTTGTASAGVLSKFPKQGLTLESTGYQARSHTQACMFLGKESHPSQQVLDKVSQPSPQCRGKESHPSPWSLKQGLTPDPTGPMQGFTPEPRGHRQGSSPGAHGLREGSTHTRARSVLGKV